jgi:hypothetical protein
MLADKIKISVGRLKNLRKNLSVGGSQCVSLSLFCAVRWSESVLFLGLVLDAPEKKIT